MEIKYIGYYDTVENKVENRKYVLSATNKMLYIISAIHKCGYNVRILSKSITLNSKCCSPKTIILNNKSILKLPFSLGRGSKIRNVLDRRIIDVQLMLMMLKASPQDIIILYHNLDPFFIIRSTKAIKKYKLILEIEEIYGDVANDKKLSNKELDFFKIADSYIFPTELLNQKINTENKPYVIVDGTYKVEEDRNCKFDDGKIHGVYAGTLDPRKGGALTAVKTGAYLDESYHIHIIGFGSESDKKYLQDQINIISANTKCTITYDGLYSGEEYIRFIQKCHFGFSTQMPGAAFNETSFPSKVLSYLANGLRVVSVRIKVLEMSKVNDLLYYYDENDPKEIAKVIIKIDMNDNYDSREVIKKLDKEFCEKIQKIWE